ncbi:chemotaxis protein CheX [Paenibacillus hamazuiensis]|uniref:chemotaxis protein CheX n=1 Tax=Paenibacillus hamazuiensis TaxID=2936508 RepID=UPI00200EAC86|nr:chemotaxis protein CheX [Paenibacillus hamazuiensis]
MQAAYINPFLASSVMVIEQLINVKPTVGELKILDVSMGGDHIWLKIGLIGQMKGDIIFGFPEQVALKIVSGMMGGFQVTQFDELSQSAIGELGNMISGNASTMLYNEGIEIDITPPNLIQGEMTGVKKAFSIPLNLPDIGGFHIYVMA